MHLIKLAVGIESVDQLSKRQLKRFKEKGRCIHITRSYPRKLELREDFTSIYWVIKGNIQARQKIREVIEIKNDQSRSICHLVLDKKVVHTEIISHHPFRGWRYMNKNIPNDLILDNKNSRKIYLILKELCLV
ncbi:MAG: hypothetical protein CFH32_00321 [Alphaproteobacteria bacterium MarineAlpha9_Bin2]|nr:MAG: hypothetical protein CFH31_00557 [Alphaproteobacteria bacterium MarineAlpha9_Bin1]PPR31128.1 MAG: hypothetical protein CFH32_00321 [Alphaproteobacteria bacterium MarineAlpha9_Bin2]